MNRDEWLLLAVRFAEAKGLSPAQLQKALFLFGHEMPQDAGEAFYQFHAHGFGPFDATVFSDAMKLGDASLLRIVESQASPGTRFVISPTGFVITDELQQIAPPRALSYLANVVAWVRDRSFSDLIKSILRKYPAFRQDGLFQANTQQ